MDKTELMGAFWPNINLREYWSNTDTCRSAWISVRSFEIKLDNENKQIIKMDHYSLDGKNVCNVGLYLWVSEYGSCVELQAHNVHSASAHELRQLSAWLTRYNAKIEKADIPKSFGIKEKLVLTLRAMGIKRGVKIDPDWNNPTRFEIKPVEYYLDNLPEYAGPLAEMEAFSKKKERVEV